MSHDSILSYWYDLLQVLIYLYLFVGEFKVLESGHYLSHISLHKNKNIISPAPINQMFKETELT